MSGSGRECILNVREWLGDPPGCPAVVGRPFRMSGSSRETLQNVWSAFPDVWESLGGPL